MAKSPRRRRAQEQEEVVEEQVAEEEQEVDPDEGEYEEDGELVGDGDGIDFDDLETGMFVELVDSDNECLALGEIVHITDEDVTVEDEQEGEITVEFQDVAAAYPLGEEEGEEEGQEEEEEPDPEPEPEEQEEEEPEPDARAEVHRSGSVQKNTVFISRGKVVDGQREEHDLEVEKFITEPAFVKVSASQTRSPMEYESVKVEVSVTLPCYAEEAEEVLKEASDMVAKHLEDELDYHMKGDDGGEAE